MVYCYDFIKEKLKSKARNELEKSYFLNEKKLCGCFYRRALISPAREGTHKETGVITESGKIVPESLIYETVKYVHPYKEEEIVHSDECVILIGNFMFSWGHLITDNLKKFWFFKTPMYQRLIANGFKVVYLTDSASDVSKDFVRLAALANVELRLFCRVEKPTKYKCVFIPDNSIVCKSDGRYFYQEYLDVIDDIKLNCFQNTPNVYEKIYLSRTKFANYNREIGEKKIEQSFRRKGFKIIYPENLSIKDQISIVNCAKVVATTEGSVAHNMVFCKPETQVIILQKADYFNEYQRIVNQAAELRVTYINAHKSIRCNKKYLFGGPFFLYITPELKRFLNLKFYLAYYFCPSFYIYLLKDFLPFRMVKKIIKCMRHS